MLDAEDIAQPLEHGGFAAIIDDARRRARNRRVVQVSLGIVVVVAGAFLYLGGGDSDSPGGGDVGGEPAMSASPRDVDPAAARLVAELEGPIARESLTKVLRGMQYNDAPPAVRKRIRARLKPLGGPDPSVPQFDGPDNAAERAFQKAIVAAGK